MKRYQLKVTRDGLSITVIQYADTSWHAIALAKGKHIGATVELIKR